MVSGFGDFYNLFVPCDKYKWRNLIDRQVCPHWWDVGGIQSLGALTFYCWCLM